MGLPAGFVGILSRAGDAMGTGQEDQTPAAQGDWSFPFPSSGAGMGVLRALMVGGEEAITAVCAEGPWTLML